MELREYWSIVSRRWRIIAAFGLLALAASLTAALTAEPSYAAKMRMVVSLPREGTSPYYFSYEGIYSFQGSEYVIDDLSEVIRSKAFAQDVSQQMGDDEEIALNTLRASRASKTHRILALTITARNRQDAERIALATKDVIEKKGREYLAQLGSADAMVKVIDPPKTSLESRAVFDVALRTALGLLTGLGVVFLVHYLDNTVNSAPEAEQLLGAKVLGEIPPHR